MTRAETHKKMIKTVLDQSPQFIKKYKPKEKVLLKEFFSLIKDHEKAETDRAGLIETLNTYCILRKKTYGMSFKVWVNTVILEA